MIKKLFLLLLFIPTLVFAETIDYTNPPLEINDRNDASVSYPYRLIFPVGSLSNQATGTIVDFVGGSLTTTYLKLDCSNSPLTGDFDAVADTDGSFNLGRVALGYNGVAGFSNYATISHYDTFNDTDFALTQSQGGWTYLNCAAISNIDFCVGGTPKIRLNGSGFSVEAQPILFGTVGSEDVELVRTGVQEVTLSSDYGDVQLDITGNTTATGTLGAGAITGTSFIIGANTLSSFANLDSLADLVYASTSFVKMTGANTFTLDTGIYQLQSEKSVANGYASLGADGLVPTAELPPALDALAVGDTDTVDLTLTGNTLTSDLIGITNPDGVPYFPSGLIIEAGQKIIVDG